MTNLPEKELFRPSEAAKYFCVALSTVYSWIETGKLEAVKIGGKTVRIKRESLLNIQKSTLS
jgi:excisionase family DNA binding protein